MYYICIVHFKIKCCKKFYQFCSWYLLLRALTLFRLFWCPLDLFNTRLSHQVSDVFLQVIDACAHFIK